MSVSLDSLVMPKSQSITSNSAHFLCYFLILFILVCCSASCYCVACVCVCLSESAIVVSSVISVLPRYTTTRMPHIDRTVETCLIQPYCKPVYFGQPSIKQQSSCDPKATYLLKLHCVIRPPAPLYNSQLGLSQGVTTIDQFDCAMTPT